MLGRGWQRLFFRNCSGNHLSRQSTGGQPTANDEKVNTHVNTYDTGGFADGQDPLALRKAAWKYGILSVLFGIVAGIIQYKRSTQEAKESVRETASQARFPSPSVKEEQEVPDALVELQLTQIELESQLKRLGERTKTEESLQELKQVKEKLAQVEKEMEAKAKS
ncbi:hypothetical protein GpartN1_g1159.t1 [Galdieria partita]|uniref:Uncharacterized protein n=1 Tax=Galdieria partita TaxID=83374 RepID=A0A9C7UN36_9RHOD|nr:hypothetical protein GpartN1_g1159.t1 [Galdieria partita]